MADYPVIDADGHVFEPDWIWERYLDPKYVDRRPRLVRDERGTTRYQLEGVMVPPGTGRGAWAPEGIQEASLHREGGVDPKARLVDMDTEGIDTAVLFGSFGMALWLPEDADFGLALTRAYNDWLADYCSTDSSRLKAIAALPLRSIDHSVAEGEVAAGSSVIPQNRIVAGVQGKMIEQRDNTAKKQLDTWSYGRNANAFSSGQHRDWDGDAFARFREEKRRDVGIA